MSEQRNIAIHSGGVIDFLRDLPEVTQELSEAETGRLILQLAARVRGDDYDTQIQEQSEVYKLLFRLYAAGLDALRERALYISEVRRAAGAKGGKARRGAD